MVILKRVSWLYHLFKRYFISCFCSHTVKMFWYFFYKIIVKELKSRYSVTGIWRFFYVQGRISVCTSNTDKSYSRGSRVTTEKNPFYLNMKKSCNNLFSILEPQRLYSNFGGKHAWPSGSRLPLTARPRCEFLRREQNVLFKILSGFIKVYLLYKKYKSLSITKQYS